MQGKSLKGPFPVDVCTHIPTQITYSHVSQKSERAGLALSPNVIIQFFSCSEGTTIKMLYVKCFMFHKTLPHADSSSRQLGSRGAGTEYPHFSGIRREAKWLVPGPYQQETQPGHRQFSDWRVPLLAIPEYESC